MTFSETFRELSKDYRIIAPRVEIGGGRYSDTDLVTYGEVKSMDEIEFFKKTFFSAKEVVFPLRETLFKYQTDGIESPRGTILPTIVFLRSCDIHALKVTDLQFLSDGAVKDNYYNGRRDKLKIFLIECAQPFTGCYCVSMGTNRTEDYAVFIRKTSGNYEVKVKDKEFEKYFPIAGEGVGPRFVEQDLQPIEIPKLIDLSIFEDELWKQYASRCLACCRCNTSCPTCTCFSVQDIKEEEGKGQGKRRRIWSSCHVKKFSLLAGGHDFRTNYAARMRYRTLHKISDFKARNGRQMCVGCGRCDDVCPVYISMFKCIENINQALAARERKV